MRFTKRLVTTVLALIMVLTLIPTTVLANDNISVTIDGQSVVFVDQQPVIIDGRTLVPARGAFEALGFVPTWDGSTQTATLTRADYTVVLTVGSASFTTNGTRHQLDVAAIMLNGRVMLPLRAVLESIGISPDNIGWDGTNRAITIVTDANVTPPTTTPTPSFVGYTHNPSIPDFGQMFGIRPVDSGVMGTRFSLEYRGGGLTIDMIDDYIGFLYSEGWRIATFESLGVGTQPQDVIYVPGHDPFFIPPGLRPSPQSTLIEGLLAIQGDETTMLPQYFSWVFSKVDHLL